MAEIINGKEISAAVKQRIKAEVKKLSEQGTVPGLAVIIVGSDPASLVYVGSKEKACAELGIHSEKYALPEETTEQELLDLIKRLNNDDNIHGILCQLPLPRSINEKAVINAISPEKDVDAFHPQNVGRIMIGDYDYLPCTPAGIMEMLRYKNIETKGKRCVVIGRSNIVGKPMAMLYAARRCHRYDMPFKNSGTWQHMQRGGHTDSRRRQTQIRYRRYGQGGCCRH